MEHTRIWQAKNRRKHSNTARNQPSCMEFGKPENSCQGKNSQKSAF